MNIADVPAEHLVNSFLKAAKKAGIDATVFYTERDGAKSSSRATSNTGPGGIARATANLKFGSGAVDAGATMLHKLSPLLRRASWWKRIFGRVGEAPTPENMPRVADFKSLDATTQENYRKIISAILGAASTQVTHSPIVGA
jgi:hypothetical protein